MISIIISVNIRLELSPVMEELASGGVSFLSIRFVTGEIIGSKIVVSGKVA
jgi:hypothetical protein